MNDVCVWLFAICSCSCVCTDMQRPEVDIYNVSQSLTVWLIKQKILHESRAHWLSLPRRIQFTSPVELQVAVRPTGHSAAIPTSVFLLAQQTLLTESGLHPKLQSLQHFTAFLVTLLWLQLPKKRWSKQNLVLSLTYGEAFPLWPSFLTLSRPGFLPC